jgi:hypothetical protein
MTDKEDQQIVINIDPTPDDHTNNEELEQLTHQLHEDLSELDVEKVDLIRKADAPAGTKAGDIITWGSLLVTLATGLLPSVINNLQSWLGRHEGHSITVEVGGDKLTISGETSDEERKRLIDAWLLRQTNKGTRRNR